MAKVSEKPALAAASVLDTDCVPVARGYKLLFSSLRTWILSQLSGLFAPLVGGFVPIENIPIALLGALRYQSVWNASTNSPDLTTGFDATKKGYWYIVGTAGTTNLNGVTDWAVGDWAIWNGAAWQKLDNTDTDANLSTQDPTNGATVTVLRTVLTNLYTAISPAFVTLTDGTTITWATAGARVNNAKVTLAGNRTLSLTGLVNGASGTLIITQDATGSRTLTLPSGSKVVGGGGTVPTLSTAAASVDIMSFLYDGTTLYWTLGKAAS